MRDWSDWSERPKMEWEIGFPLRDPKMIDALGGFLQLVMTASEVTSKPKPSQGDGVYEHTYMA